MHSGDHECVNIYFLKTVSILKTARLPLSQWDPHTGTGTTYGFSGLELGCANMIADLEEKLCICRGWHLVTADSGTGISHHSITVLLFNIPFSGIAFDGCKRRIRIMENRENGLRDKHRIILWMALAFRALNIIIYPPLWAGVNEEPFFLCDWSCRMVWFKKYFTALV